MIFPPLSEVSPSPTGKLLGGIPGPTQDQKPVQNCFMVVFATPVSRTSPWLLLQLSPRYPVKLGGGAVIVANLEDRASAELTETAETDATLASDAEATLAEAADALRALALAGERGQEPPWRLPFEVAGQACKGISPLYMTFAYEPEDGRM